MTITLLAEAGNAIIPPRTKKNHSRIVRTKGRALVMPSLDYLEWEAAVLVHLVREGRIHLTYLLRDPDKKKPVVRYQADDLIVHDVNCRALIYRDRDVGDAVGYYQAIGDLLQKAGIVHNDRLIRSWDGSRLLKDPGRPRVEVCLQPIQDAVPQSLFVEASPK